MTEHDGTNGDRRGDDTADAVHRQAVDWFVRLRAGDVDAAEHHGFAAWYRADPRHAEAYRAVAAVWDAPALDDALRAAGPSPAAPPQAAVVAAADHRSPWRRLAIAAALLIAVLGGALQADLPLRLAADHVTATGEQRRVALADGSRLLLDSGSAVAVTLGGNERRVRLLHGRAYFEVARDPARPFVVAAGTARVRVTGTAFAVALDDADARVAVRHGAVEVAGSRALEAAAARLGPGDAARIGGGEVAVRRDVDVVSAIAWTQGRLAFEDRPLGEVVAELRRYHSGLLLVASDRLAAVRLTGSYRLDDPAGTAARLAELAGGRLVRLTDHLLVLH